MANPLSKAIGKAAKRIGGRKLSGAVRRGLRSAEQTAAKVLVPKSLRSAAKRSIQLGRGPLERRSLVGLHGENIRGRVQGARFVGAQRAHDLRSANRQIGTIKAALAGGFGAAVASATVGTAKALKAERRRKRGKA